MSDAATSTLGKFVWHDLMCTDVARAKAFYTALFPNWHFRTVPFAGFEYEMIEVGGLPAGGIVPFEASHGIPTHWVSYVHVQDATATVAAMVAAGGKTCVPIFEAPGVGKFAVMTDPQGALIKPYEPAKPPVLPAVPTAGNFVWDELMTTDIMSAQVFYAKVFGWGIREKPMGPDFVYTLFMKGEEMIAGGMKLPPEVQAPPHWLTYLVSEDVDATAAKAPAAGGKVIAPPTDIPTIGRFSVLQDAAGGVFALIRFASPA